MLQREAGGLENKGPSMGSAEKYRQGNTGGILVGGGGGGAGVGCGESLSTLIWLLRRLSAD